ncbi:MAG: hypothetical protein DRP10_00895 [Candidatus Aenigmatarchaeota archaeon]|nr:MAG: hypothetical protein DRP10_00895 [Candidatus Aenigmarchaeota archaeon]
MVASPFSILFEIFFVIFYKTVNTIIVVFKLFIELVHSLGYSISVAGPLGIILAFVVLFPLIYFLAKFFFGSVKIALISFFVLFLLLIFILSII